MLWVCHAGASDTNVEKMMGVYSGGNNCGFLRPAVSGRVADRPSQCPATFDPPDGAASDVTSDPRTPIKRHEMWHVSEPCQPLLRRPLWRYERMRPATRSQSPQGFYGRVKLLITGELNWDEFIWLLF